ncbi:MAG: FMN-binding protein [Bacillota bacterium]
MSNSVALKQQRGLDLREILAVRLKWLLFIVVLGTFSSSLLMGLSYLIPSNLAGLELEMKRGVLMALDLDFTEGNIDRVFQEHITVEELEELTLYWSKEGGVAFTFTGMGFQGPISGIIGLQPGRKTLRGLVIMQQQETPGLGGRITEQEFLRQFKGLAMDPRLVILPAGRKATAENEVEGITGATMTIQALEDMLNRRILAVVQKLEVN